jgi:hypothetical protein
MRHCKMVGENMVPAHDGCKAHVGYTQEMFGFVLERARQALFRRILER